MGVLLPIIPAFPLELFLLCDKISCVRANSFPLLMRTVILVLFVLVSFAAGGWEQEALVLGGETKAPRPVHELQTAGVRIKAVTPRCVKQLTVFCWHLYVHTDFC